MIIHKHSRTADRIGSTKYPGVSMISHEYITVGFYSASDLANHIVDSFDFQAVVDLNTQSKTFVFKSRSNIVG